jgi:hypothetical protein
VQPFLNSFDYLNPSFEMHVIEWLIPESAHESLEHYAQRMSKYVEFPNAVLIGVSFGGVMVQEMKKYRASQTGHHHFQY